MSQVNFLGNNYPVDLSEIQMELVAADLAILLKHSGFSRADIARKLGWKKSRITRMLSGDSNLTIRTIHQFADALGYSFDVVFHNQESPKPKQPWQIRKEIKQIPLPKYTMQLQDGDEVFDDLIAGKDAAGYIRIDHLNNLEQTNISKMPTQMLDDLHTQVLTVNKERVYEYRT